MTLRDSEMASAAAILDALSSNICVVDRRGRITAVNRAWRKFELDNSAIPAQFGVGADYLEMCRHASGDDSTGAREFASGLQAVLDGEIEFYALEYPCHTPTQSRWFLVHVTPLRTNAGGAVIAHTDITDRKAIEGELAKLAATDWLTGLPNRRYFMDAASEEWERVRRFGGPVSLVMIDLDEFKALNDNYGHAAGDAALRRAAEACKSGVARMDILARFGGEEFVALMPGKNEAAAQAAAERLRLAVIKSSHEGQQSRPAITASFGVTEVGPKDKSIDDGLLRADAALYFAKGAGRNCVKSFSEIAGGRADEVAGSNAFGVGALGRTAEARRRVDHAR